jgi:tetratricopeptide (TPR) repeat protein
MSHRSSLNESSLISLIKQDQSNHATPSLQAPQPYRPGSRPISPPPHIVGQIVEMGFSPQQARIALAATDTGLDVQAALETLLSNGAGDTSTPPPPSLDRDYGARPPPRRPPNQRVNSTRDRELPRGAEREMQQPQELNVQAEKIIAQASEIGINVLNRANAFWKESKEKAQRIYEERANVARVGAQRGDGRPRWISEEGVGTEQRDRRVTDGFKDDDENPSLIVRSTRRPEGPKIQPSPQIVGSPSQSRLNEVDLFSSETPVYQSPYRRGRLTQQPQPPAAPSRPAPVPSPPKPQCAPVPASPSALSASASHKAKGTSAYKLGQYADAESAYSFAIAALPASHILLIPLHNNRALTRLKTGDVRGAIDDCTTVIELVGSDRGVFEEVDLRDALVKAWRRRAEAREGRERWEEARKDWESVAGAEWAPPNVRGEGVRGVGRCKRMLNLNTDEVQPAPRPKPKPKAPSTKPVPIPAKSEALEALRAATSAAEAEENERYELKDSVDARLTAWKGGKETNIRALIASLDSILWPELGWQKVGMHELVANAQVKSRYTRAIARLHPDKVGFCYVRFCPVRHRYMLPFSYIVFLVWDCKS